LLSKKPFALSFEEEPPPNEDYFEEISSVACIYSRKPIEVNRNRIQHVRFSKIKIPLMFICSYSCMLPSVFRTLHYSAEVANEWRYTFTLPYG
jgi:hypothetical protein